MRKRLFAILGVLVVLAAAAYAFREPLAIAVMRAVAKRNIGVSIVPTLADGLHVGLCGAGSPLPDPNRSGPCVTVIAGRTVFVVDAGTRGARTFVRMKVPPGDIKAVFLTHFHSDHIDGLGELGMLRWVGAANTTPLPVYGPPGVERVVAGFNEAYAADATYRTAHHGPTVAPPSGAGLRAERFDVPADGTPRVVWDADGVRVTAFTVEHPPVSPAVGYRFEYGGRSLVLSGDTKKCAAVERQAKGADLLVHEALAAHLVAIMHDTAVAAGAAGIAKITHDIPDYHTTPVEAAEIAAAADVRALLYYHIVPPLPLPGLQSAFLRGVGDVYHGPVVVGTDGTFVSLPTGTTEVIFTNLL